MVSTFYVNYFEICTYVPMYLYPLITQLIRRRENSLHRVDSKLRQLNMYRGVYVCMYIVNYIAWENLAIEFELIDFEQYVHTR